MGRVMWISPSGNLQPLSSLNLSVVCPTGTATLCEFYAQYSLLFPSTNHRQDCVWYTNISSECDLTSGPAYVLVSMLMLGLLDIDIQLLCYTDACAWFSCLCRIPALPGFVSDC
eukprot:scpid111500/ scgid6981/ 